jgi:hypothetical protein
VIKKLHEIFIGTSGKPILLDEIYMQISLESLFQNFCPEESISSSDWLSKNPINGRIVRLRNDPERNLYLRLDQNPANYYEYFITRDVHAQPTWSERSRPNYQRDEIPLIGHTVPLLDLRTKLTKIALVNDCVIEGAKIDHLRGHLQIIENIISFLTQKDNQSSSKISDKIKDLLSCAKLSAVVVAVFEQICQSPESKFKDVDAISSVECVVQKTRDLLISRKYFSAPILEEINAYGNHREKQGVIGLFEIETALSNIALSAKSNDNKSESLKSVENTFSDLSSTLVSRYKKLSREIQFGATSATVIRPDNSVLSNSTSATNKIDSRIFICC